MAVGTAKALPSGCHSTLELASASVSSLRISPSTSLTSFGVSVLIEYTYITPSVQETARYEPLGWKDTCLAGFDCSRRYRTFSISSVLTTLTTSSLWWSVFLSQVTRLLRHTRLLQPPICHLVIERYHERVGCTALGFCLGSRFAVSTCILFHPRIRR